MKKVIGIAVLLLLVPQTALAVITFHELDQNTFTVSHAVKWTGGRGVAMDVVYEKAASLCIAAGYTHLVVLSQESNAGGEYESANATVNVKFFQETGESRIACHVKATEKYIKQAAKKLDNQGYTGPPPVDTSAEAETTESHCTVEQITAMSKAGMTDAQIKAACAEKN
jgi:hypothetical protein